MAEGAEDALKELGNVAFSHAATALSALVGRRVNLSMPSVRMTLTERLEEEIEERDEPTYVITLRILGERQGTLSLLFTETDALALADMLEGAPVGSRTALSPASRAVLAEVSNIMSGAALLAMYRLLRISLIHSTPVIHVCTHGCSAFLAASGRPGGEVCILVEAEFAIADQTARGQMVISLADIGFFLAALEEYAGGA